VSVLAALLLVLLQGIQIPRPQGYVNDFAHVIPEGNAARITRIIEDVRAKSGGEITVVTIADIGDRDVGDVALQIGREWGVGQNAKIGDRARNAGVVILVVPKETSSDGRGHISIQTGQGSEGFITDATAGDIRREATPLLVQQDYGGALELMTLRVAQRFAGEFGFQLDTSFRAPEAVQRTPRSRGRGIDPGVLVIAFVVLMFVLGSMGRGRRRGCGGCLPIFIPFGGGGGYRGGGWGGGGFGGGGFGGGGGGGFGGFGGGGGFSGGGSSGSW
jgi:uncharacterized protein